MKIFQLATKWLWRDWRAGEWMIVYFSLILAIAAVTALNFYTDRLMRGLDQQSAKFLGGNLVVSSPSQFPSAWVEKIKSLQLKSAEVWTYPSIISAKNNLQLVNLQAVSDNYPLIGNRLSHLDSKTIWVEPRLLSLLNTPLNSSVSIGAATFQVTTLLTSDVDSLNTGWMIAPRVLMRLDDVAATKTVLPGSRIEYRLLIVGEPTQLKKFQDWIRPQLKAGQRLIDVRNQQFVLKNILERTENFLQLALLICLMMSGIAIALSVQQYLRRHYSHIALWRCLGAKEKQILTIFLWELFLISFSASVVGVGMGFIAQYFFSNLFSEWITFPLPSVSFMPVLLGFLTDLILLFAFSYPIVSQLPRVSPLFIWRNEITLKNNHSQFYFIFSLFVFFIFLFWFTNYSFLTLFFLHILLLSIAILYAISLLILGLFRKIIIHTDGVVRRGFSQILQFHDSFSVQFVGFTLIFMLLFVLGWIQSDLIKDWKKSLPSNTPNYFAFNIAENDINNLNDFFQSHQIVTSGIYPMVRGRLIELNERPIMMAIPESARGHNTLHRELNISWMWDFPSDNKVVEGELWSRKDEGKPLISIEKEMADDLNLKIGDVLTFQMGEEKISAHIINIRTLGWQSFHPNFYVIFVPGVLNHFFSTFITSFHLQSDQKNILNLLIQRFPNMTIIDVANIMEQVQSLLNKIIIAVQYLFSFVLIAAIFILIVSVQSSLDERRQNFYLIRVLGASRNFILKSIIVEAGSIIILIGLFSFFLAKIIVFLLEKNIFNF